MVSALQIMLQLGKLQQLWLWKPLQMYILAKPWARSVIVKGSTIVANRR